MSGGCKLDGTPRIWPPTPEPTGNHPLCRLLLILGGNRLGGGGKGGSKGIPPCGAANTSSEPRAPFRAGG